MTSGMKTTNYSKENVCWKILQYIFLDLHFLLYEGNKLVSHIIDTEKLFAN